MIGAWLSSLVIFISTTIKSTGKWESSILIITSSTTPCGFLIDLSVKHSSTKKACNSPTWWWPNAALGRMIILALVSNMDLVKVIPPISLVIISALESLFFTGREFIMIALIVSQSWILLGFLWGVHMPLRNFAYDGICLMASINGMVMVIKCSGKSFIFIMSAEIFWIWLISHTWRSSSTCLYGS